MPSHTKFSKILVNPINNDWLRAGTEELWPASTKVVFHGRGARITMLMPHKVLKALEKYPGSQEPS